MIHAYFLPLFHSNLLHFQNNSNTDTNSTVGGLAIDVVSFVLRLRGSYSKKILFHVWLPPTGTCVGTFVSQNLLFAFRNVDSGLLHIYSYSHIFNISGNSLAIQCLERHTLIAKSKGSIPD